MPLTHKGTEILEKMRETYPTEKKAKEVFYASKNAGTITGVDSAQVEGEKIQPIPIARAAGVMCIGPDGQVLLMRRTDGEGWAFPGGGMEGEESAEEAARRELFEETGVQHEGKLEFWTRRIKDGVDFTTHLAHVDEKFAPTLNHEHDMFTWAERTFAMDQLPLHPGVKIALLKFDMDELHIAQAMRAGELAGPVRYGNVMLVAIRITGTGAAYRKGVDEYVWRDPSIYLNDQFLQRCNGLPVIFEHPTHKVKDKDGKEKTISGPLESKDFRNRTVGTVFLPYIQGDEVWSIAKIYDALMMDVIDTHPLSTSPCAVFREEDVVGAKRVMPNGSSLLIEGKPSLLDHIALLSELGVWDKGGPLAGVLNPDITQSDGESIMDVEVKKEVPYAYAAVGGIVDKKEGTELDKVLAHLDAAMTKHCGPITKRMDEMSSRMDAFEKGGKKDGEKDNEKEKPEPAAADKTAADKAAADKARADAEEQRGKESENKALEDERKENDLKRNGQCTCGRSGGGSCRSQEAHSR